MKSIVQEAFRRLEAERAAEAEHPTPWAELKIRYVIDEPVGGKKRYYWKLEDGPLPAMEKKLQKLAEGHRAIVYRNHGRREFTVHYPIGFEWKTYYVRKVS